MPIHEKTSAGSSGVPPPRYPWPRA